MKLHFVLCGLCVFLSSQYVRNLSLFKKKGTRENYFLSTSIFMKERNFESNKRKTVEEVPIRPSKLQTNTHMFCVTPRLYLTHPTTVTHGYICLTPQQRSRLANSPVPTEGAGVWFNEWEERRTTFTSKYLQLIINITQPSLNNPQLTTHNPINNVMMSILPNRYYSTFPE